MAPNVVDIPLSADPESLTNGVKVTDTPLPRPVQLVNNAPNNAQNYKLQIFNSSLNLLAHIFIGFVVGATLLFAFRNGLPLGATPLHIVLCVIGYHLLMAQAILSLSSENGWSSKLRIIDRRRAHWILQIMGSGLAIAGSSIKILDKAIHWNTYHGQFALVALVFTTASLVNGLASLYAYELRSIVSGNLSKITHICFGTVAFVSATICLCYGLDKNMFKNWATPAFAYTVMALAAALTTISIIKPLINFVDKSTNALKN